MGEIIQQCPSDKELMNNIYKTLVEFSKNKIKFNLNKNVKKRLIETSRRRQTHGKKNT